MGRLRRLRMRLRSLRAWMCGRFRLPLRRCWKCWRPCMPAEAARKIRVSCVVNGTAVTCEAYPMARLLDVLREKLKRTGKKEGGGGGEGGSCAIKRDGGLGNSCWGPGWRGEGAKIR